MRVAGGKGRELRVQPPDSRCPAPRPALAAPARLHHQQRPPPPHGRVLPRNVPSSELQIYTLASQGAGPACRLRALLGSGPLEAARGRSRFGEEMVLTRLVALRPLTLKLLGCKELTQDCCHCCGCWVRK